MKEKTFYTLYTCCGNILTNTNDEDLYNDLFIGKSSIEIGIFSDFVL